MSQEFEDRNEKVLDLVERLLKFQQEHGFEKARVPALVGHTQIGKTYYVKNILAKKLRLEVKGLLLQQYSPDEVSGFQRFVKVDSVNKLQRILPDWWPTEPSIIFLDEIDKARDELLATILTFMREGRIGDYKLPQGSVIIAAMNETEYPFPEPFLARCCFLPFFPRKRSRILKSLEEKVVNRIKNPRLPRQVDTPQAVWFIEEFITVNVDIVDDEEKLVYLCGGLFVPELVRVAVEDIREMFFVTKTIDYRKLLDSNKWERFIESRSLEELQNDLIEVIFVSKEGDAERVMKIFERLGDNLDVITAFLNGVNEKLEQREEEVATKVVDLKFNEKISKLQFDWLKRVFERAKNNMENLKKGGGK